jgi:hypothetical protein
MPQILRIGPYIICFCSNESDPLEPVHVNITEGRASANINLPTTNCMKLC